VIPIREWGDAGVLFLHRRLSPATPKEKNSFDTSVLIVGKGKAYAESEVRSKKNPGTG
jgi:hypothetical protein